MEHFQQLSTEQKRAVSVVRGPVLCLAGPGSGKTFTLVRRLRFLIEKAGIPPETILVATYSKAAALSMRQRFFTEMGRNVPVTFGTLHAVCYHILKERYVIRENNLLSDREKRKILQSVLQANMVYREEAAEELLECVSLRKNGRPVEEIPLPAGMGAAEFEHLYRTYRETSRRAGRLDFDDMALWCLELLEREPAVLKNWQARFTYFLIDEFQDCNLIQYEVAKKLACPRDNLFAVGDDDQSIYGFRGASPGVMERFIRDFPGAEVICMGGNYRSRPEIVKAAGSVIAENQDRMEKRLFAAGGVGALAGVPPVEILCFRDQREQFSYLGDKLRKLREQMPYEEMAVICRTNRELRALHPFLRERDIPCRMAENGGKPYACFAVRDVLDYLRLAEGARDRECFLRVLNRPERHIKREWLWDEKIDLEDLERELRGAGEGRAAESVRSLMGQLARMRDMSPSLAIRFVRGAVGYEKWLRGRAGEEGQLYEEWKEELDRLQQSARNFEGIGAFLAYKEQEKERPEGESGKRSTGGVSLLTMHASKGLEFTYVCLPGLNEKKGASQKGPADMPKAREEEERRLFYVGMTRAKKALELLYLTGTKERPRQPSRFLRPLLASKGDPL